jgi:hypothetical protein
MRFPLTVQLPLFIRRIGLVDDAKLIPEVWKERIRLEKFLSKGPTSTFRDGVIIIGPITVRNHVVIKPHSSFEFCLITIRKDKKCGLKA